MIYEGKGLRRVILIIMLYQEGPPRRHESILSKKVDVIRA